MLRPLLLVAALSVVGLGCFAAPRTVETTVELGAAQVQIDVRLSDIRAFAADDLNQLRVFSVHAKWKPQWLDETPWAPAPSRYEFSSDGGRLDLVMHGSMSRSDFDRCARPPVDGGEVACPKFPLELRKARYALVDDVLHSKSLAIDPKAVTSWPADGGRIALACRIIDSDAKFLEDGPSLAPGFALVARDPTGAAATVEKINASEALFLRGKVAEWTAQLAALQACAEQPWCALRQEASRRNQLDLVHAYLASRPEAGKALGDPPEEFGGYVTNPYAALAPKDSLAPIDDLRLRVAYDIQLDEFRAHRRFPASGWDSVCRPETMKKATLRDFCLRLGAKLPGK